MKQGKKIFWGVLFILGAVALIVGKLGYLGDIGFWSIFFTIGLIGLLVEGIFSRNFGTILFSLAFLAIVNDELLGIQALTPWPVLGAAFLGTLGLNILFPKKYKWENHISKKKQQTDEEIVIDGINGEEIQFEVTFGDSVRYVTSKELSEVRCSCTFGNLEIYLDNAELKNNEAVVKVGCTFGNVALHVPADWRVIQNIGTTFGEVCESGCCNASGMNTLYVKGNISFGNLDIKYM